MLQGAGHRAWHGAWVPKGGLDKGPAALLSLPYFNPNYSGLTTHAWLPPGARLSFSLNVLQPCHYPCYPPPSLATERGKLASKYLPSTKAGG